MGVGASSSGVLWFNTSGVCYKWCYPKIGSNSFPFIELEDSRCESTHLSTKSARTALHFVAHSFHAAVCLIQESSVALNAFAGVQVRVSVFLFSRSHF
jgi:hypothetical protein